MALSRAFEEHEIGADARRIFDDVRRSFDLPFVPSIFKLAAANHEYLSCMWEDLGPVVRSHEFQAACKALGELVRSQVVSGGWSFTDQEKVLAGQKFSVQDTKVMAEVVSLFTRALVRLSLFSRLMQRGFLGGQPGRSNPLRQASALSRMLTLHIPSESEAGIRSWLLYSDIKKTTGSRYIPGLFRILSPYQGYLASVWLDTKHMMNQPGFLRARDETVRRAGSIITGLPVKNHRLLARSLSPQEWREIEETVDSFVRSLPQFALLAAIWERSFPQANRIFTAA